VVSTKGGCEVYQYQLKRGQLKLKDVRLVDDGWYVIGVRSDNGLEDKFPIQYFQKFFKKISQTQND
jgi:hypothetical protein